ncbi:MAG: DNA topoisomerase-3 [Parvicellaceae bacterium]|jgi:DNA topoisomerase-3
MKVCIAEKPSVAKEIAEVLGAKSRRDGFYEGNGYQVTWTFGHLCTLKEPNDYTEKWKWWNINALPMLPSTFGIKLKDDAGIKKQFKTIENLVSQCEEVINCGDAGQEGELIQRWVLAKAKCNKPLKRLWISSLTEEAIREGFQNLQDGHDFDNLYYAGISRAIGDWILGMNCTRLFTLKYAKDKQVLSVGRVQTPTLAMIVERQKEIENFTSERYWELKTVYRDVLFSSDQGKITEKEKGDGFVNQIKEANFTINSFEQKEGKESPPRLFDLTAIQVECNNKFGFSAEYTLNYVQKLYEKKLVTYPRVDTTYLPDDVYPKIGGILKNLRFYSQLTESLLGKEIRKSNKVFNNKKVTDHHAIIPTGVTPSAITPQEQNVYDTITKRFIAAFYPDCTVSNTTVLGEAAEVGFKATGKQIIDPGWRVVYSGDKTESIEEKSMPLFEQGESGKHAPQLQEKNTQPPKYYTEATLLRGMETAGKQVDDDELRDIMKENGIGRPSTRANIIETLFRRKYIRKEKKNLVATVTGIGLIDTIKVDILKSPELTGQWEKKLRDIEKGEYKAAQFKEEMFRMVTDVCHQVKYDYTSAKIELASDKLVKEKVKRTTVKVDIADLKCPKCQKGAILTGKTAWGCQEWKNGCDFKIPFEIMGKKIKDNHLAQLIEKKKTSKLKGFKIPGSEEAKEGKLVLTADFNVELD